MSAVAGDRSADDHAVRELVRSGYTKVAETAGGCCAGACGCGDGGGQDRLAQQAEAIGYTKGDLSQVPDGANLGLGCGNPVALAALEPGQVVLDLGAGAGFDALLAARQVGPKGRVIGVDMTPAMLERARANAVKAGVHGQVEFREGIVESLPVTSGSVDVVISNCVINLSPDKAQVFHEAFRVLKPGGKLAVSDILLSAPLPDAIRQLASLYVGCVAGALVAEEYLGHIRAAGFTDVQVSRTPAAPLLDFASDPTLGAVVAAFGEERIRAIAATVWSYRIEARKPLA